MNYIAYLVEDHDEVFVGSIQSLPKPQTQDQHILIRVHYSSLNYKDALSSTGNKGVTRNYPHTPGIDAVGIIEESRSELFNKGDQVIVTGNDLGMNTFGGFGEYIHVPADWAVRLPENLTMKESMIYGTAGFTAALSIHKLTQFIKPEDGNILVTGASGGVGSLAVRILSRIGYTVIAVSNKPNYYETLKQFGASKIITREEATDNSTRPMISGKWQGIIDTVGGDMLSSVLKALNLNGVATCCGNLRGHDFTTSIYPFIIRGITLMGITSASCDMKTRKQLWNLMANKWKPEALHHTVTEITLSELESSVKMMLQGKLKGRTIVKLI